jgi:hypothetical protein
MGRGTRKGGSAAADHLLDQGRDLRVLLAGLQHADDDVGGDLAGLDGVRLAAGHLTLAHDHRGCDQRDVSVHMHAKVAARSKKRQQALAKRRRFTRAGVRRDDCVARRKVATERGVVLGRGTLGSYKRGQRIAGTRKHAEEFLSPI